MHSIGVIGDKDSILGFKAIGLSVFEAYTENEAEALIEKLSSSGYAVIYITEQLVDKMMIVMEKYNSRMTPALIPIPGSKGSLGIGLGVVKKAVEKAVGADILDAF